VLELIGRFGVGFYSAFMVADRIVVETRKAGEDEGWRWTSTGQGGYTIESAEGLSRGTVVALHLREPEETADGGKEDFLSEWRIREIVREYSDFVEYPIQMEIERMEVPRDEEGKPIEGAKPETVRRVETLNSRKPLWARPKEQIEKKEYDEFYHHLTHDWGEPLEVIHFKAEGSLDYTALLYLPKERGIEVFDPTTTHSRLSLYVRRVLIMRECEDLLPGWLRFVRGVVESADLPLNVARETLQASHEVRQIKKRLVKKVLEALADLCERDRPAYEGFWSSFGPILKEGIYHGEDEEGRLAHLLLFRSSKQEGWTTLSEYIDRMPVAQKEIYTLVGTDRTTIERSPHLEALRGKGTEVLLLTDAVDEWMLQRAVSSRAKTCARSRRAIRARRRGRQAFARGEAEGIQGSPRCSAEGARRAGSRGALLDSTQGERGGPRLGRAVSERAHGADPPARWSGPARSQARARAELEHPCPRSQAPVRRRRARPGLEEYAGSSSGGAARRRFPLPARASELVADLMVRR
jgi:molecular chaperone HtpG